MKHTYTPPPLREHRGHQSAADIQRDINLMRVMYARRRNANHRAHSEMIGYSLLAVAIGLPILAAIAILIAR